MAIRWCITHQCGWYFPIHEEAKKDGRPCAPMISQEYVKAIEEFDARIGTVVKARRSATEHLTGPIAELTTDVDKIEWRRIKRALDEIEKQAVFAMLLARRLGRE